LYNDRWSILIKAPADRPDNRERFYWGARFGHVMIEGGDFIMIQGGNNEVGGVLRDYQVISHAFIMQDGCFSFDL